MDFGGLKVLMISTDRNIFSPGSAVSERMKEYGALADELHIVVLSDKSHKLKDFQLEKNVWVYSVNASHKYRRPFCAAKVGKKIVYDRKFVRGRSVITAQDPFECGWAGLKVKKKWRIPLEVQLHTDPYSPYFTGVLNKVRRHISKKVIKNADSLRVVNRSLRDKITEEFGVGAGRVSVLPIYVDQEKVKNEQVKFDLRAKFHWQFTILAVSRLSPEKDLPTALRALSIIRNRFSDTGLVIVGSGPEEGKLRALAQSLGLENNVAFEGWQEDLASYYKTANAFIQTSLFEGYGLSLVEAGLSGLPVVSTPVGLAGGLQDEKELYICPPGNTEFFASAIIDLIEHNQKRENLRVNMSHTLEQKLLSKEDYLRELRKNWEQTSQKIKA